MWFLWLAALVVLTLTWSLSTLWYERRRRQRAEVEARHHLSAMAHMDRRAALGELTASLTHELSQPLSAVLRNAEAARMLLASGAATDHEIHAIVEAIRRGGQRAVEIIQRTRSLLQRSELESAPVDVNTVAREAVELVAPDAAQKGVRMNLETPDTPSLVSGDRVHLEQVMLNLLLNSIDALTDVPEGRRHLLVRTQPGISHVDVSVHDTGPGIPEGAITQVFEPFFTTKREGMGMGLSVARSIVEAHRGRIVAENNSDRGATVRFSLPLQQ